MSSAIGVLVVLVIIFLIMREVWCWYWKINEALVVFRQLAEASAEQSRIAIRQAEIAMEQVELMKQHIELTRQSATSLFQSLSR